MRPAQNQTPDRLQMRMQRVRSEEHHHDRRSDPDGPEQAARRILHGAQRKQLRRREIDRDGGHEHQRGRRRQS